MPVFCRGVLPQPKVSVLRRQELAFIRFSLLQLKIHCPGITSEDVRKSGLLAELTHVMSEGVAQDLWILSIGVDNNPWGQHQPLIFTKVHTLLASDSSPHSDPNALSHTTAYSQSEESRLFYSQHKTVDTTKMWDNHKSSTVHCLWNYKEYEGGELL